MKKSKEQVVRRKIKDLPTHISISGIKFYDPKTKTTGYWQSQWGYPGTGQAGVWYKKDLKSVQVFPLCLDNLKEALEFEVIEK